MNRIAIASIAFAIAVVCAGLMGYAIQRGATCLVAAIDELVTQRRATRVLALIEAGVWVAGGLIVAHLLGGLKMFPVGHHVGVMSIIGGALLGVGALTNRACVFGAIARLGSGEWAYALTPVGFYIGCLIAGIWMSATPAIMTPSPLFAAASALVFPLAAFVAWRGIEAFGAVRRREFAAHIWSPHRATMVIGLAFVVMLLTVGSWAYTEALASFARGMSSNTTAKLLLFVALLLGALLGGWTAGRLRFIAPTASGLVRCLIGGALMGIGSVLIPGSNDGLILLGLPLLNLYALVALVSMTLAIVGGMFVERQLLRR